MKHVFTFLFAATAFITSSTITAQSININGPAGSGQFGYSVTVLPNGNYIIADPYFDDGAIVDVGAVYLYNGGTHALISTLKGSTTNDKVGLDGITVLSNGNYLIRSQSWDNGAATDAGAVTFCNGTTGVSGIVSIGNSLAGSTTNDKIGSNPITMLSNSNYIVISLNWDNGVATNAGAVTFGSGATGVSGIITNSNSLVGSSANDQAGWGGISILSNGNYLVKSPLWSSGLNGGAGALTLGNSTTGISGIISSTNSLVGSSVNDIIGNNVMTLPNGNYLAISTLWNNGAVIDAGAVTFGNGTTGVTGVVSNINSLVGSKTNDQIGSYSIRIFSNGSYLVRSDIWDNGLATDAGAVTFGNATTGVSGVVSSINSLVGSTANDKVGTYITIFSNGNYVVSSLTWDNGAVVDAGAATFGNGTTGVSGVINSGNSLVGSNVNDAVGIPTELSNGNYVVNSSSWNGGRGAATFANGTTGVVGLVNSSNSLVGTTAGDNVGYIDALTNGNYLVRGQNWDNGAIVNVGSITFCNGTTGRSGAVSSINSLVGSAANDNISSTGITLLSNGNAVVRSQNWDNGAVVNAGAVTFVNGITGVTGAINSANSLVGSAANDQVGNGGIGVLSNGNYVIQSPTWRNGAITGAGAVTFCNGTTGFSGTISNVNSLVGSTLNDQVGLFVSVLTNGNYVVNCAGWDNGAAVNAGAVTFGNGTTGTSGVVTSSNSLVGSNTNDNIGADGVLALTNGNYVVFSRYWNGNFGAVTFGNGTTGVTGVVSSSNSLVGTAANDYVGINGALQLTNAGYVVRSGSWNGNRGAVTFGNGTTGVSGVISSSNSLVGGSVNDNVGSSGLTALSNGNYIVTTNNWRNGAAAFAGSTSFGNGITGVSGVISSSNSLVGTAANDYVSSVTVLTNDNYIVQSPTWDNGVITDAGAIALGNGSAGVRGVITSCNSVIGSAASGGYSMVSGYNYVFDYLLVGRRSDNIVTAFYPTGMVLANSLDVATVNISGTNAVPLITNSACRIIGTLKPNGVVATQVKGTVNAKVWIEPTVPFYAGKPYVARHFEITPATNAATATGRVTLYCTQQEFDDFNADPASTFDLPAYPTDILGKYDLKIGKYPGTSSNGSGLPGTYTGPNQVIDPVDNDIVWNSLLNRWEISFDVTGFSGFIIQSNSYLLPLSILSFDGLLQNNDGLLNWKTTNEINAQSFDIERSIDGRNYAVVGNRVAFNTAVDHLYDFIDKKITALGAPVVYYRLKQNDISGRFTYSNIVALLIDGSKPIVMLYPNPVIDRANLTITINKPEKLQGRIIDNTGKLVKQMQWNLLSGSTTLPVDVKTLAKGFYYLELKGDSFSERRQFVKQ